MSSEYLLDERGIGDVTLDEHVARIARDGCEVRRVPRVRERIEVDEALVRPTRQRVTHER